MEHEYVLYKNEKIMVKTIPKGTLMFRLTKSTKDDLRGYPKKDGTRCILSNHNVFFYPNPFVGKIALGRFIKSSGYKNITVYILKNDVKILWLIKPSKYARTEKNKKNSFLKRCNKTRRGCVDKEHPKGSHATYNPCFSEDFIEENPDIVGLMAIAVGDMARLKYGLKSDTPGKKFFHFATDSNEYESIPELILHPLRRRPSQDRIVKQNEKLQTNYKELTQIDLTDEKALIDFMEKHAIYNPKTYFYTYRQ